MSDNTIKRSKEKKQDKPAEKQEKPAEKQDGSGLVPPRGNQARQQRKRPGWPNQAKDQNKQG